MGSENGRCIQTPLNETVSRINSYVISKFPGESVVKKSADSILDDELTTAYTTEFLNTIELPGMPPHSLELKPNCPVMMLRNLHPSEGHVNGARYRVNNILSFVIDATVSSGTHMGKSVLIPRIIFQPTNKCIPFRMQRRQFPLRLCFAVTINKSQGQTFIRTGLYLTRSLMVSCTLPCQEFETQLISAL